MSDVFAEETTTAPSKKSILARLKGLSKKAKIITAASIVVALGGGGAFAYTALNTPDAVVGLALASAFTDSHPSWEFDVKVSGTGTNGSGTLDVYTAETGTFVSLKAAVMLGNEPVGATLNVLGTKAGDAYLNLADFDSLGVYLITAGLLPAETVTSARTTLTNNWVKISKQEIDSYTSLLIPSDTPNDPCITKLLSNPDYNKKVQGELMSILRNNNFIVAKKELPGSNGERVFELGINAEHLRGFLTATKSSTYYKDIATCVPSVNISDAQIQEITQAKIDDSLNNENLDVTTTLYADAFSHKLKKIDFKATSTGSNQTLDLTFKPLGDQSKKVVIPTKTTTLTEMLTTLSGGASN